MSLPIRIRPLESLDELDEGVELQRETWGREFDDIVSSALMGVAQKIGGVAAGAFDPDDRLIGMIFGLTGIRNDERVHWSHMLAVQPPWRGLGLGTFLKAYQRRRARSLGVRNMYWTFDPLEARNAHFNINRLGAQIESYVPDMYGSGETSTLHRGIGTDRFVVRWPLYEPRVDQLLEPVEYLMTWTDLEAVTDLAPDLSGASPHEHSRSKPQSPNAPGRITVDIPADIQRLKIERPDEASNWRAETRSAFTRHLSTGMNVTGFAREPGTGRCYYILGAAPPPREYRTPTRPQRPR